MKTTNKNFSDFSPHVKDAVWSIFEEVACDDRATEYLKDLLVIAEEVFDMGPDEFEKFSGIDTQVGKLEVFKITSKVNFNHLN